MTLARWRSLASSNAFLGALFAACIVRLWLMALPSSFWIDEMGTVFVVEHGASHPSFAIAPQVPDSLYYWLPRLSSSLLGQSEIAYRLPSILAALATLYLLARLAARLVHPDAGWFAVFAALTIHEFNEHAADARPYALGMCVGAACLFFLVRWLDSAHWRDAALFTVCAILLWPIHLIYWPFYLVPASYTAVRLARRETRVPIAHAVAIFALVACALVPAALRALRLMHNAGAHVILALPSVHHFEWTLRWKLPLAAGLTAWLAARLFHWQRDAKPAAASAIYLALAWWLAQPVCLFSYSYLTGNSAYVPRYISLALPGLALTSAFAVRPFFSASQWKPLAAVLGIGAFVLLGQWTLLWPEHQHSDWRGAATLANREAPNASIPVICTSPFVEAQWPRWRPDYPLPGFLYAHLPVYPLKGRAILFPFERGPESEQYAAQLLSGPLTGAGRFLIYGGAGNVRDWRWWFASRPELSGWSHRLIRFGDVYLVLFTRP